MKMNRREFLQAVMAAAVVANIPFTEAEAVEAYESLGIQDLGNGWYRCWISYAEGSKDQTFSTYAKAGESSHMQLSHGRVRAWFDLVTGEVGKVSVSNDYVAPQIKGEGLIWGCQLEEGLRAPTQYIPTSS